MVKNIDGSLYTKSEGPNNLKNNAVIQKIRGGLSRYGCPLSNKCKKFPFRKISLLIEAYCIASISIMVLNIPNAQLQIVIRIR